MTLNSFGKTPGVNINNLARYYDSRTGTFCSADPLAGSPGDPQSWNRYPYGRNDPIDVTDPSGQHWWNTLLDFLFGLGEEPPSPPAEPDDAGNPGVWNDSWNLPYGGLTRSRCSKAFGLPTMAGCW